MVLCFLSFFFYFSFSPPPVLREDQVGGMVTSWHSYAICLRPGIKICCSCEAGTLPWLGGLGLLPLMRLLTFSCHFCSCFDSQRFVVAMACLMVWHAAVGNAASLGRHEELATLTQEQVGMSRVPSFSFRRDKAYLPLSKLMQTLTSLPFFFPPHEVRRRLSVLL